MDKRTRLLWTELTGDEISKSSAWKAYHAHVERRNNVAHGAMLFARHPTEDMTQEDAEASVRAVRDLRAHIDRVTNTQVDEIVEARARGEEDQWRALRFLNPRPVEISPDPETSG